MIAICERCGGQREVTTPEFSAQLLDNNNVFVRRMAWAAVCKPGCQNLKPLRGVSNA